MLSDEEMDTIRLQVSDEIEKTSAYNWWDVCAAFEKMHGMDAANTAEQILIDITNKTSAKVAKAQAELTRAETLREVGEWLNDPNNAQYQPTSVENPKYKGESIPTRRADAGKGGVMLKLGDKIHTCGDLHLGKWIRPMTEGTLVGRKSGDYGTLWLVQIGEEIFTLAPAEILEAQHETHLS